MTLPRCHHLLCIFGFIGVAFFSQSALGQSTFTIRDRTSSAITETADTLKLYPVTEYTTATPWRDRVATYKGVLLSMLLDGRVACDNAIAEISAQNGYVVRVELQRLFDYGAMLAFQINGAPIPVTEKGPFAILFPYHKGFPYLSAETITLSVWYATELSICS